MKTLISLYEEKNKYEAKLLASGYKYIAGVDEVGRGPLAGPVTIGAVILDPNNPVYGLKDSKKLSHKQIEKLALEIYESAICAVVVNAKPETIDKYGISNVIRTSMRKGILKMNPRPDYVLIDHEKINFKSIPSMAITKGDDNSNSIAAASIIAKYERDKYMINLGKIHPQYGFENHVGYGTKKHRDAIEQFGSIEGVHRYSFKPIRKD